jgi:hypothetical protein
MNKKIYTIVWTVVLILTSSCKSTEFFGGEENWILLGEIKANHIFEKDVLRIKNRERFTALQLYVTTKDVEIKNFTVTFINGDILQPSIESVVRQGERSRIIELAADGRQLEKITLRYKSLGKILTRKGRVQIGGRLYDPSRPY